MNLVIWKIGGCNYSLKIVKAAVSIESQVMLTAARQSRRHCSFERYHLNGVYLTENDTSQSCCEHPLKDLKVRLLVFIVIIITKLDPDRQRSLNTFQMLSPPTQVLQSRGQRPATELIISSPALLHGAAY